ncbi:MAG: OB-fold nucleic acid binding domain-containing protein, partial [Bacteroidota bacterium]
FNKSHSVAYSVLAYQTAYLKAHFPAEYMAATLSSEMGNTDKIVLLIDDCRKLGIAVLPPDVNESGVNFVATPKGIRFGLSAIKNVGVSAVEQIVKSRTEKGNFHDIFDFCAHVDLRLVNKKTIESLIQAGAFDSLSDNRAKLFAAVERAIAYGQHAQEQLVRGQNNLFEAGGAKIQVKPLLPHVNPWNETETLSREKAVLGFYVSGHPLMKYVDEIDAFATVKLGQVENFSNNSAVRVCGIVTALKKKVDKRGNLMAFVTIEDFTGKAECIVFSDAFKKYSQLLESDSMVMVSGKGEISGDSLKILVNDVTAIDSLREKFTKSIVLYLNLDQVSDQTVVEMRELMEKHRGKCMCYFSVSGGGLMKNSIYFTRKYAVEPNGQFIDAMKQLLGASAVQLQGP